MSEDETGGSSPSNSGAGKSCYISPRPRTRPAHPGTPIPDGRVPLLQPGGQSSEEDEDKVGYGKPPKNTRFREGESGNPNGRPKGAKGLNTLVRKYMTAKVRVRTDSGVKQMSAIEAMILKLLEQAMKGNQRAASKLLDIYAAAVPDQPKTDAGLQAPVLTQTDEAILALYRDQILSEKGVE